MPKLDMKNSIVVPSERDGDTIMPIGGLLLSLASTYGRLDTFKTLMSHDALIDGHVLEKVFNCGDETTTKNQYKGRS